MDPSYVSSDDEAEGMAKQMGFSSFGKQGPTQKRKFNPATDAMVEGQELAALNQGGKKGKGSGGNMIPLGKSRVIGVAPPANEDEIALDEKEEDDDDDDEGPAYMDTSLPPPQEQIANRIALSVDEESLSYQQKIDAILAGSPALAIPPGSKRRIEPPSVPPGRGVGQFIPALHEAPRLPIPTTAVPITQMMNKSSIGNQESRERGQRNPFWYVNYFDRSFIENPWASLEQAKGVQD